jgi:hypothetical protein
LQEKWVCEFEIATKTYSNLGKFDLGLGRHLADTEGSQVFALFGKLGNEAGLVF